MVNRITALSMLMIAVTTWEITALGQDQRQTTDERAVAEWTELYRVNLENNLRWMLARERTKLNDVDGDHRLSPRVGVFADYGVWHLGAGSIVEALEREGVACQVLDRSMMVPSELSKLDTIVLPGGWAPFQLAALEKSAQDALRQFVRGGGRCVGVCAGAYLVSRIARWEETDYPYPLELFEGTAAGPVPGLARWPQSDSVRLGVTLEGRKLALDAIDGTAFYFRGGSYFIGGKGVTTLARYPNGSSAVIQFSYGKGDVVLSGVHFERPAPKDGGDEAPTPAIAGPILKSLMTRSSSARPRSPAPPTP